MFFVLLADFKNIYPLNVQKVLLSNDSFAVRRNEGIPMKELTKSQDLVSF